MSETATVKAWDLPIHRQMMAKKYGVEKNFCFITYGGLGDVLCSEPTVRYAVEVLKPLLGVKSITVVTRHPQLFSHLPVETLQADENGFLDIDDGLKKYHFLYLGAHEDNLQNLFFTHNTMLPIDYPALSALRCQLPLRYRTLKTTVAKNPIDVYYKVVIHAGNHWKSKCFPKRWWDDVINNISTFTKPVLIGGPPNTTDQKNPGTVDVDSTDCTDLRGKLSIAQSAAVLRDAEVVITNDSLPLHLATIGKAQIGFLATAKDPEWLMHYRRDLEGEIKFGWGMDNLAQGGAYQRSYTEGMNSKKISQATSIELMRWLPEAHTVARYAQKWARP